MRFDFQWYWKLFVLLFTVGLCCLCLLCAIRRYLGVCSLPSHSYCTNTSINKWCLNLAVCSELLAEPCHFFRSSSTEVEIVLLLHPSLQETTKEVALRFLFRFIYPSKTMETTLKSEQKAVLEEGCYCFPCGGSVAAGVGNDWGCSCLCIWTNPPLKNGKTHTSGTSFPR